MFKVKEFMSKITDKSSSQNSSGGSGSGEPSGGVGSIVQDEQDSAEGFLCPVCMTAFSSPEVLADHYQKLHDEANSGEIKSSLLQDKDEAAAIQTLSQLQQEVAEGNYDHLNSLDVKTDSTGVCAAAIKVAAEAGKKLIEERATNNLLNEGLEQIVQKMQSEEDEKLNLYSKISSLEEEIRLLQKFKDSSSKEIQTEVVLENVDENKEIIETLNIELRNATARFEEEQAKFRRECSSQESKHAEIIVQKDAMINKLEESLNSLKQEKELHQKQSKTEIEQIKLELQKVLKEKDTKISKLQRELSDAKEAFDLEKRTLEDELKIITSAQSSDVQASNERVCRLERELKAQIHTNEVQARLFKDSIQSTVQVLGSTHDLSSNFVSKVDSKLNYISDKLNVFPSKVATLQETVVKSLHDSRQENNLLKEKSNVMTREHINEIKTYEDKIKSLSNTIDLLKQNHEKEKKKLINDFNSATSLSKSELSKKCAILKKFQETLKSELQDHLSKYKIQNEDVNVQLDEYIQKVNVNLKNADALKHEINSLNQTHKEEINRQKEKLNEIVTKNSTLGSDLKVKENNLKALTISLSKLEEEKSNLQKQIDTNLENQKIEIKLKEDIIEKLKDDFKCVQAACTEKTEALNATLKNSEALNIELEKNRQELEACKVKLSDSTESSSKMSSELAEMKNQINLFQQEYDNLKAMKQELEKKFKTSEEGKALLLERCLSGESETEKLQETIQDLRRKLDDSFSALQELGRENQSLQMESAKLQGRKWTDDAVVNACQNVSCAKEFSLTIRKHHCRQCGNIFCSECSSKTASIPSSKKPVRVCDTCYDDLVSKSK